MKATRGWVVIVASAVVTFSLFGGAYAEGEVTLPAEEEIKAANEVAAEVESEKTLKEQERKADAKLHAEAADNALQDGNYQMAIEELNAALAADPDNQLYKETLRLARIRQISDLLTKKKFAEAIKLCDDFLKDFPGDIQVADFKARATEELQKPEVVEKKPEIVAPPPVAEALPSADNIVAEAEDYILKKDYKKALDKLEEAHKVNPYDIRIDKMMKQVREQLTRYERAYYQALRQEMLTEVYAAWTRRPRRRVTLEAIEITPPVKESKAKDEIYRKLETIVPEVRFEDAKLREVVDYLSRQAGVNIVIDPVVFTGYTSRIPSLGLETTPGLPGTTTPGGPTMTPGTMPGTEGTFGPTGDFITPGVTPPTVGPTYPETAAPGTRSWIPPMEDTGIQISLQNVPLKEVLRYVLRYKSLKYIVEDYAIVVVPVDWVPPESLETEVFRLATTGIGIIERPSLGPTTTGTGTEEYTTMTGRRPSLLRGPSSFEGGGETGTGFPGAEGQPGATETIKDFLLNSGVPWPRGSNIIYNSRVGTLIVINTPTNMVLIRELVNLWDQPALQVEIEARFVEILHTRLFENSFQLGMLSPLTFTETAKGGPLPAGVRRQYQLDIHPERGTRFFPQLSPTEFPTPDADQILSIRGIMTEPDFQFIWHAIDQRDWSDLLSAPRITTISGQQAQIEVVQELTYPTEYDTETINIGGGWGGTTNLISGEVFMVTPGNWEKRDVGIILNVTPTVSADGKMITLMLMPEVTDLVTWINYGNEIYPIQQPIFETRNITTTVHVNDGETIVLGGLITDKTTTYEDKVPLLGSIPFIGRFFRTNAETSSKANLVIFVTARLITSRGTELAEERAITEEQKRFLEQKLRESKEEVGEMAPGLGTTGIIE